MKLKKTVHYCSSYYDIDNMIFSLAALDMKHLKA